MTYYNQYKAGAPLDHVLANPDIRKCFKDLICNYFHGLINNDFPFYISDLRVSENFPFGNKPFIAFKMHLANKKPVKKVVSWGKS